MSDRDPPSIETVPSSAAAGNTSARVRFAFSLRQICRQRSISHIPVIFFSRRTVPQTPPSFVKFRRRASSVSTGSRVSIPSSDQVPELISAVAHRFATEAKAEAGIVARGRDYHRVGKSRLGGDLRTKGGDHRAGLDQGREKVRRDTKGMQKFVGPLARAHIQELRCGGICVFAGDLAGQPEMEEVRHHDQMFGLLEDARRLRGGGT